MARLVTARVKEGGGVGRRYCFRVVVINFRVAQFNSWIMYDLQTLFYTGILGHEEIKKEILVQY